MLRYAANRSCCECNDTQAAARQLAKRFELSRRHDNLTFNHHREVAALQPDEADALLDWLGDLDRQLD
jgi:hypothetical protein